MFSTRRKFMKRVAVCLIVMLVISIFAAVAGRGNGQQDDNTKAPKTDKLGVRQDDQPKAKFRKVETDAVPGQYLVYLTDEVKLVANQLFREYSLLKRTKQGQNRTKTTYKNPVHRR